jgi:hypothetical protein
MVAAVGGMAVPAAIYAVVGYLLLAGSGSAVTGAERGDPGQPGSPG